MLATVKIKDMYSLDGKTERDCHHFYCKCNRYNSDIFFVIIGSYFINGIHGMIEEGNALIKVFKNDINAAMDKLDRLKKLLNEAKEQIDKQEGGSL